jgi:hypothetical protein
MSQTIANVTDATKRDFYKQALGAKREIEKIAAEMRSANGKYRSILKAAEAAGVSADAITYTLKNRHLDREDLASVERDRVRMMALSGVWPKIQTELFAVSTAPVDNPAETTIEVAYDHGHQCGVKGEARTINPHPAGTEHWDAWERGWLLGQTKNVPGRTRAAAKPRGRGKLKLVEAPVEPLFGE